MYCNTTHKIQGNKMKKIVKPNVYLPKDFEEQIDQCEDVYEECLEPQEEKATRREDNMYIGLNFDENISSENHADTRKWMPSHGKCFKITVVIVLLLCSMAVVIMGGFMSNLSRNLQNTKNYMREGGKNFEHLAKYWIYTLSGGYIILL